MFTLQAHIRAAAFGALLAVAASGATLRFGDVTTDAQGYLHVPVTIAAEDYEQVAGLQFDLNFDETNFAFMDVVLGPSAENAGKDAVFTDAFTGTTRVLVVGMNQNTMQDGVVAELVFNPLDASALDSLELTGGLVSDPFGNSIRADFEKEITETYDETIESGEGNSVEATPTKTPESSSDPETNSGDSPALPPIANQLRSMGGFGGGANDALSASGRAQPARDHSVATSRQAGAEVGSAGTFGGKSGVQYSPGASRIVSTRSSSSNTAAGQLGAGSSPLPARQSLWTDQFATTDSVAPPMKRAERVSFSGYPELRTDVTNALLSDNERESDHSLSSSLSSRNAAAVAGWLALVGGLLGVRAAVFAYAVTPWKPRR